MEKNYLKVIEALGEILHKKDETIKYQGYEIEALKNKLKEIENKINSYT